jgi:uncharacterized protein
VGEGVVPLAREDVNYIRNSVKATVDAYDGSVTLYEFDETDPVLRAWNAAFGGDLVVPREDIPAELLQHFRYPQDMFKVQRNLLAQFYVTNPGEFFAGTDFWQVPRTPANPDLQLLQPPYYLLTQFPEQASPTFQLTSALSPVNRRNLAAVVSGAYVDGDLRLQAWSLPSDTRIAGPEQVHQDMVNASAIRQELTLLEAGGSAVVTYGNLLSLPYQDGMLYVEPVYVQTRTAEAFPLMQKVLMSYGQYVTLSDSLEDGLANLVEQGQRGVPTIGDDEAPPEEPPAETPPGSPPPAEQPEPPAAPPGVAEAEADLAAAMDELRAAEQSGDFVRYAQAAQAVLEAWEAYQAALEAAGEGG